MARNDVYLNINALSPADAVVTGQQDMTAATVPELVLGDTPTFNFYFTDNTNVWPSWAGNASYTLTWALSDAVAGDFAPAATTGNATPITGGWSVILPLNSYDLVGLLNTKRVGQPYPVQNLWQQLRVTDPSGNEVTRAMFWTPVRYRAISDTQNTESASPTGGRFVTVNNVNTLTTPTAAQFYAANPVPTSALGTAANGELLIGNGTGFTKATLTAGSGVSITNGSGSITITATDGDITLDDGTAAAPSLKFTADTDTGLFRPSDNVVGISAGGVSRATFGATSAINGTTIPSSKTLVVTTDKLSALAATTSAELAGVISDETGSGALVFANTPTLVTPNIGAATGTSFNLTGSGTLGTTLTVNGTTDSSSKDTGAIVTEGGLGVEKSATIGGNLTVSGTGTSSFSGPIAISASGTDAAGFRAITTSSAQTGYVRVGADTVSAIYDIGVGGSAHSLTAIRDKLYTYANGAVRSTMDTSGNLVLTTGNLTVSGTGVSTFSSEIAANKSGSNISFPASGSTAKSGLWTNADGTMTWGDYATGTKSLKLNTTTGDATIAGNLTVSGTGTSGIGGNLVVGGGSLAGSERLMVRRATTGYTIITTDGTHSFSIYNGGGAAWIGTSSNHPLDFFTNGSASQARLATSGNFLLATTTDSANGKLQLATHTTSAGGIGFGTDVTLYRSASNTLWVGAATLKLNSTLDLQWDGPGYLTFSSAASLVVRNSSAAAILTLDGATKNATFEGTVTANNIITANTGNDYGLTGIRTSAATNATARAALIQHTTSGDMVDGQGAAVAFALRDSAAVTNIVGDITCVRAGADNTGDIVFRPYTTGTANERMRVRANGRINFASLPTSSAGLAAGDIWNDGGTLKIV